jgi:aminoglycoside phosphotransferase (APT) family kinase protein
MSGTTASSDAEVTDTTVRGMVRTLEPTWTVASIERSPYGIDFVAVLTVETDDERRQVALKATTAGLVDSTIARSEPRMLGLVGRETTIPVPGVVGYCDDHEVYPAPFFLLEYVDGENYEARADSLDAVAASESYTRQARTSHDYTRSGRSPRTAASVSPRDG